VRIKRLFLLIIAVLAVAGCAPASQQSAEQTYFASETPNITASPDTGDSDSSALPISATASEQPQQPEPVQDDLVPQGAITTEPSTVEPTPQSTDSTEQSDAPPDTPPLDASLSVRFIDVGQGDSAFLVCDGKTIRY